MQLKINDEEITCKSWRFEGNREMHNYSIYFGPDAGEYILVSPPSYELWIDEKLFKWGMENDITIIEDGDILVILDQPNPNPIRHENIKR